MNVENRPIVAKFGGTSMASPESIKQVAEIVHRNPDRRYVVVSAPGKREDFPQGDIKITNLLFQCDELVQEGLPFDQAFDIVSARFEDIGRGLGIHTSVVGWLNEVKNGIAAGNGKDWTASRGEWLSAQAFAKFMGGSFVDAENLIRLRQNGQVSQLTYKIIERQLAPGSVYVIPGYYGRDGKGAIKVFPRGGSDITGAIIAKGVHAGLYENWTDVDGVKSADPRIFDRKQQKDIRTVNTITGREMREFAYRGADVLQVDSILPALYEGIPINVRNTFNPDHPGTMILQERESSGEELVIGIAGRQDFASIQISKDGMNRGIGTVRRLLRVLEKRNVSFEHDPTGLDAMSIILDQTTLKRENASGLIDEIREAIKADDISIISDLGLVCVVGQPIETKPTHVKHKVFSALDNAGIAAVGDIHAVNGNNIVIITRNDQVANAIRELYRTFIQ